MACLPILALALQILEPRPAQVELGDEVEVRWQPAFEEVASEPELWLREPGGAERSLGAIRGGQLRFVPEAIGDHQLRVDLSATRRVLAPLHVRPRPRRWLYALWAVPVGGLLLFRHLVALRRTRRPSPPAP